ncbi:MAG: serine O-acetyltransferase [Pseudomonadales bacterium]|nr:serine O-acetyltransferase [Pseudomonadales bacterium]
MNDKIWQTIREEIEIEIKKEPILASFFHATILNHDNIASAISFHLAGKLDCQATSAIQIREVIEEALNADPSIVDATCKDISAVRDRDSACDTYSMPFLYFKGFHALQSYRIAHWLWTNGRESLALYFQHRISMVYGVDIHPAAKLGHGIMLDHATGVVIGETAVVGNNVSIMQSVTLGGTGKEHGDRHPKVGDGVLISCGAKVLGNIQIGEGAKVGAGSVVLQDVPPHTTVAGVPAKVIGKPQAQQPALEMNHQISCDMENCSD